MKMESVDVYCSEAGLVCLKQGDYEESLIVLHPDQISTVIKWIKEAKKEAEEKADK